MSSGPTGGWGSLCRALVALSALASGLVYGIWGLLGERPHPRTALAVGLLVGIVGGRFWAEVDSEHPERWR